MAATKKALARPVKKTKAEVQKEFTDIREELQDDREELVAKSSELEKAREAEIRQHVEGLSMDSVVQRFSALSIDVAKSLGSLSEQLVAEVGRLEEVRQAIEAEKRELERLHKIDVAATALDQLVQDYEQRRQQLEAEIAGKRSAWEEEARATERERKEQEEALRKQRQREIEDYEYRKNLERKKAQDKYDEEIRLQEKKNTERQELLEKGWAERERVIKEREEELARMQREIDEFPQRLQREVERAQAEAAKQAESRYAQEILVLKKDAEAEHRVAELRIRSLEETVAHQSALVASMQKHLDEAKQQVQDIAVKAIEGASGSRALAHINQIAMEQAKNRPQG